MLEVTEMTTKSDIIQETNFISLVVMCKIITNFTHHNNYKYWINITLPYEKLKFKEEK